MKHVTLNTFQEFRCLHCQAPVHIDHHYARVHNRNHCPFCLWSRHLDWFEAGDRMSPCKAAMQPIGLTLKATRNKYGSSGGELMLVHRCQDCAHVSINRIAADDNAEGILRVFTESLRMRKAQLMGIQNSGIRLLQANDAMLVQKRLYGIPCNSPEYLPV